MPADNSAEHMARIRQESIVRRRERKTQLDRLKLLFDGVIDGRESPTDVVAEAATLVSLWALTQLAAGKIPIRHATDVAAVVRAAEAWLARAESQPPSEDIAEWRRALLDVSGQAADAGLVDLTRPVVERQRDNKGKFTKE